MRTKLHLFFLYLLLAVVFTFPLVLKMSSATYGYPGDNFGAIHYFWWWKYTKLNNLPLRDSFLEEYPFGITLDRESGTILYYWPVKALTSVTNAVFAYNLVLLLSFPLAAYAMYLLVKEVTGNRRASFLAGLIFGFLPYHSWKAYNHLDLALIWTLPLYVRALLRLEKQPTVRRALAAGIWLAAIVLTNFYYGYFMVLFSVAWVLARLICGAWVSRRVYLTKNLLAKYLILAASSLILILPFTYHIFAAAPDPVASGQGILRQESYQRPLLNLLSLSARPWDYLIPSQDHPIFGRFVPSLYGWIQRQSADFKTISAPPHERTIFLGFTSLGLAALAVWLVAKQKSFAKKYGGVVWPLVGVAAVLLVVSMPPYIFVSGVRINLPSFYLYRVFPMFRSYARLGVVVALCTTLLAGVGASHLFAQLKYFQPPGLKILLLCCFGVVFEFLNFPPAKVTAFSPLPPEYQWLTEQPGDVSIVEYPKEFNVADSLLMQIRHHKGVLNFHGVSPYYGLWRSLEYHGDWRTAEKLAALGIDYAFIHNELVFDQPNPVDDLWYTRALKAPFDPSDGIPPGFELEKEFPKTVVLQVAVADPPKMVVLREDRDNAVVEWVGENSWGWSKEENRLYLQNLYPRLDPRVATVRLGWQLSVEDLKRLGSVTLNGEAVAISPQGVSLELEPYENVLEIRKVDGGLIQFDNLELKIFPVEY